MDSNDKDAALIVAKQLLQELLNCPYDLIAQDMARDWLRDYGKKINTTLELK